jgi:ParB family transcriptional regulator, chromosome partitioning protein
MTRLGGLGRGLDALIPAAAPGESGLITVRLGQIVANRRQPRGEFEQERLEELAHSLRRVGMLQPVLVRPLLDSKYELIAGERRVRAARLAGFDEIPAIVRQTEDAHLLTEALVENIHRVDLNPLEEAAAYQQLLDDFGLTHEELAERLGRSRPAITNTLRLLQLSPPLQQRVAEGSLRPGHARALLAIENPSHQQLLAQRVVEEGLSVRATEELVRQFTERSPRNQVQRTPTPSASKPNPFRHVEQRLTDVFATKVSVAGDEKRGRIVIDYAGQEDLQRILGILGHGAGANLTRDET